MKPGLNWRSINGLLFNFGAAPTELEVDLKNLQRNGSDRQKFGSITIQVKAIHPYEAEGRNRLDFG